MSATNPTVPPEQVLKNIRYSLTLNHPLMNRPEALNAAAQAAAQAVSDITGCAFVVMPKLDKQSIDDFCKSFLN